jgi:hypothetical protein
MTKKVYFLSNKALFFECWVDHVFPVAEETYQFFIFIVFSLSVAILEADVREGDEFPQFHVFCHFHMYLVQVARVFGVDFPLEALIGALDEVDHLLFD